MRSALKVTAKPAVICMRIVTFRHEKENKPINQADFDCFLFSIFRESESLQALNGIQHVYIVE